jgi:hypothetical protein
MVAVSNLSKSLIMPSVTVRIAMPSGVIAPALAAPAYAVSLIMPPVTADIQMPVGAGAPARAATPQNTSAQIATDPSHGTK